MFIVHAHHEPRSFNGATTRLACERLEAAGQEVRISDLYAMGFDPISDRRNFMTVADGTYLKQQAEETYVAAHDGFAPDIQAEMDKLFWCDLLILQFPLWWFAMPAILKGRVDRVFAAGGCIYGGGKWYDRRVFVGKRAMCAVTVGGGEGMYGADGLNGPIGTILFPINRGILAFTGFTVVEPFLVYAPARMSPEERSDFLEAYARRVLSIGSAPTLRYRSLDDFDETYRLKQGPSMKVQEPIRELRDEWQLSGGRMTAAGDAALIDDMLGRQLVQVAGGGWRVLFRHRETGQYWELTYPKGEMHGGGPRLLRSLDIQDPGHWNG